jgi:putative hydrolase of the HAD superfamily
MECFPQRAATRAEAGHLAHEVFGHAEWQAFDRGTIAMQDVIAQVAERVGVDASTLGALVESIGERLTPMPESVALFKRLVALRAQRVAEGAEPLRLYYLSNMPVPYARDLERMNAYLSEFDGGIFSGDELLIKPEPAIYQRLQTRYTLDPAKTVFLDDLLPNIAAAQAEGWHGIHFHTAQQATQELQALGLKERSP